MDCLEPGFRRTPVGTVVICEPPTDTREVNQQPCVEYKLWILWKEQKKVYFYFINLKFEK